MDRGDWWATYSPWIPQMWETNEATEHKLTNNHVFFCILKPKKELSQK